MRKKAMANLDEKRQSPDSSGFSGNSHNPRQSQNIYRWPHTEQDIPRERCNKEDGSDDVQVGVRLGVVSG
jgi:hypothetical protein